MTTIGLKSGKKSINWVFGHFRDLKMTLNLKLHTLNFLQAETTYRSYIFHSLRFIRYTVSKLQSKICEKCGKTSLDWGASGPYTQVKCLLKA